MKPFAFRAAALCCCLLAFSAFAAGPPATDTLPPRVMLIGLFHFDNPGLDAVKFTPIDVMQPKQQAYLQQLSARIAAFKPTRVLLEFPPKNDALYNQRYRDYLAGNFQLQANEIYQLGFRIASIAGLKQVHGFDERDSPSDGALWEYLPKEEPATMKRLAALIAELSARFEREHRTLSLRELLVKANSAEDDKLNKGFYIMLNAIGADRGRFVGADASAQWWQRNFRMYANVQRHAAAGERVVVIAGSGHTAILRDLLRLDNQRVEEDVQRYF